jgi:uncharacterized membrane protein
MKAFTPQAQKILDDYLQRLAQALQSLREPDCQEIFREIQSHIYERLEQNEEILLEPEDVLEVLYKLGEPSSYISLYLTDAYLQKGFEQRSPGLLLRGILRWMGSSALSYLYSFPFFVLYFVSLLLFTVGVAKALFPNHIVLYAYQPEEILKEIGEAGSSHFAFGFSFSTGKPLNADDMRHEIFGHWLVPIGIIGGILLGIGATALLRWMTRWLLAKQYGF